MHENSISFNRKSPTMKKVFYSILVLSSLLSHAQKRPITHEDSAIIKHHLEYAELYLEKLEYRTAVDFYNKAAYLYWSYDEFKEAINIYQESWKAIPNLEDHNLTATVSNNLGTLHSDLGNIDTALYFFKRNLDAREALGQKVGAISALINIAVILNRKNEYKTSLEYLKKARDYSLDIEDFEQLGRCYASFSEIYTALNNEESAHDYFKLYQYVSELNSVGTTKSKLQEIKNREAGINNN